MKVTPWDGKPISAPGIYSGVPIETYHSAAICDGPSTSSGHLRAIFTKSPLDYWIFSPVNPNCLTPPEKEAFILGRGAHHLLLGEAEFSKSFIVQPETYTDAKTGEVKKWSGNATVCREWKARVSDTNLTILTAGQIEAIRGMAGVLPWQAGLEDSGLKNTAVVQAGALEGLVEHTIIAKDEETGIWIKSRPDVIPLDSLQFNDFKTSNDVSDEAIRRTLDEFRYDMQAQLADECLRGAIGEAFSDFGFIFAAKTPPYATNAVELDAEDLAEAAKDNRTALRTLARCLDTGKWPGPAGRRGDAAYIRRSNWSLTSASTRREFLEREIAA